MQIELQQQLKQKYPLIFADLLNPNADMRSTCMVWGLEVGDGWYKLIDELCSKIEPMIQKIVEDKEYDEDFGHPRASQVKEKYASLRFDIWGATDEMWELTEAALDKSQTVCELCGKENIKIIDTGGWLYAECEGCWSKRRNS